MQEVLFRVGLKIFQAIWPQCDISTVGRGKGANPEATSRYQRNDNASGALSKYGFVMNDEHGVAEVGLVGEVPYYATIFTTRMTSNLDGYEETADRMAELVSAREGFLGMQSARGDDGLGITVCYWRTEEDITAWRNDLEHENAQDEGRSRWYAQYTVEVARVDRTIEFRRPS